MYVKFELYMDKSYKALPSANICTNKKEIERKLMRLEGQYDFVLVFASFLIEDSFFFFFLRARKIRNMCMRGSRAMKKRH